MSYFSNSVVSCVLVENSLGIMGIGTGAWTDIPRRVARSRGWVMEVVMANEVRV
jgi:hypothetical protein